MFEELLAAPLDCSSGSSSSQEVASQRVLQLLYALENRPLRAHETRSIKALTTQFLEKHDLKSDKQLQALLNARFSFDYLPGVSKLQLPALSFSNKSSTRSSNNLTISEDSVVASSGASGMRNNRTFVASTAQLSDVTTTTAAAGVEGSVESRSPKCMMPSLPLSIPHLPQLQQHGKRYYICSFKRQSTALWSNFRVYLEGTRELNATGSAFVTSAQWLEQPLLLFGAKKFKSSPNSGSAASYCNVYTQQDSKLWKGEKAAIGRVVRTGQNYLGYEFVDSSVSAATPSVAAVAAVATTVVSSVSSATATTVNNAATSAVVSTSEEAALSGAGIIRDTQPQNDALNSTLPVHESSNDSATVTAAAAVECVDEVSREQQSTVSAETTAVADDVAAIVANNNNNNSNTNINSSNNNSCNTATSAGSPRPTSTASTSSHDSTPTTTTAVAPTSNSNSNSSRDAILIAVSSKGMDKLIHINGVAISTPSVQNNNTAVATTQETAAAAAATASSPSAAATASTAAGMSVVVGEETLVEAGLQSIMAPYLQKLLNSTRSPTAPAMRVDNNNRNNNSSSSSNGSSSAQHVQLLRSRQARKVPAAGARRGGSLHTVAFSESSRVSAPSRKNLVMDAVTTESLQRGAAEALQSVTEWSADASKPPLLQIGKLEENVFSLDFYGLSPFQAFVVALAAFDQ